MAKILWKRICEGYAMTLPMVIWIDMSVIFNSWEDNTPLVDVFVFSAVILAMSIVLVLGGISSEPPRAVFIAPFSREDRRRLVIKLFCGKIAMGMAVMAVSCVLAVVFGKLSLTGAFVVCIITFAMMYVISFIKFYTAKQTSMIVIGSILVIADVIMIMNAYGGELLSFGKNSEAILLIIAVVLLIIHYFAGRKYFEPMIECYSDYEKLMNINETIKRNKEI